jgi:DNA modification methylase
MKQIIENIKVSAIKPFERNARKNDKAVSEVAKSIQRTGYRTPIIIDENNIILAGHTRLKAIQKLGWKEIPFVVQYTDLDEKQKQEYRIRDNKTGEIAEWDFEILEADFSSDELLEFGFDIKDLTQPEIEEDEAPPVPEIARTVKGDIYQLGNHRVMCGDSTMIDDVDKLMDGKKADMVFTSPPYNANTKAGQGDIFNGKEGKRLYDNGYKDNLSTNVYIDFAKSVLENCFLFTDGFIFWNVSYNANAKYEYLKQIEDRIDYLVEQICWKKSSAIPFKGMLRRAWEPIFLFSTSKISLGTEKVETNFWEVSNTDSQQENHKACFPVALVAKGIDLVKNSTILFDPFCGSGSTIIACEQTNRICYGMELDEKYCDVIVQRWVNLTGGKVILNGKEVEWNAAK